MSSPRFVICEVSAPKGAGSAISYTALRLQRCAPALPRSGRDVFSWETP